MLAVPIPDAKDAFLPALVAVVMPSLYLQCSAIFAPGTSFNVYYSTRRTSIMVAPPV